MRQTPHVIRPTLSYRLGMTSRLSNLRTSSVRTGFVTCRASVRADDVFDLIIDVDRLPEWNRQIPRVVKTLGTLSEGSEWVIVQRGLGPGVRWDSRARVIRLDRIERRFVYRSGPDGPNPSFAVWTWNVKQVNEGSLITVSWQLNPKTFWRRTLAAGIRHRQLRREVRTSLEAMTRLVADATRESVNSR